MSSGVTRSGSPFSPGRAQTDEAAESADCSVDMTTSAVALRLFFLHTG